MVSDNKKAEAGAAAKSDASTKDKSAPAEASPKLAARERPAKEKSAPAEGSPKAEAAETGAAPATYSRGEGQKAVTRAYKENWNAIFAKKSIRKSIKKRVNAKKKKR
jgi:hypothetical protein